MAETSLQVSVTRKEFEGDYTLVTFPLLKITHQAPDVTGNAIGEWMVANVPEVSAFNSVKGFLNLSFSPVYWNEALKDIASEGATGQLPSTGKRIMVEFSSPNTNKPLHLGHIRNNLLGDSVSRILKACGNDVIKATLVNDRGVHICKSMYAWQKLFNGATPESTGKKGDHLVGDCYVAYAKMEKEHPEVLDDVHKMLVKWEEGDPEVRALWTMMNGWVFKGFDETYKALGISFDKVDHESDTYLLGKELVQEGLRKGVFETRNRTAASGATSPPTAWTASWSSAETEHRSTSPRIWAPPSAVLPSTIWTPTCTWWVTSRTTTSRSSSSSLESWALTGHPASTTSHTAWWSSRKAR